MKTVLFICVENSCRSQMAEGFAKNLGRDIIEAHSAGSRPSGKINPEAIKVMQEVGIDISYQKSKGFEELSIKKFNYVVTMGCEKACPFVPAKQSIGWQIEDPNGKGLEFFRKVRDDIVEKVKELIKENAPPTL